MTRQVCSIARALELVGERWTLLIIRDVFLGVRRFEDLQRDLGIARNVLASRLDKLTADGILERRRYSEHPPRDEFLLTEQGLDLWPTVVALMQWGDQYRAEPATGRRPCSSTRAAAARSAPSHLRALRRRARRA